MNDNSFLSSSTVNLYKRNIEILEEKLKVMEKDSNEKRKRIKELIERIALMEKENEYLKTATTAESENCDMRKVIDELRKEYKIINEDNNILIEKIKEYEMERMMSRKENFNEENIFNYDNVLTEYTVMIQNEIKIIAKYIDVYFSCDDISKIPDIYSITNFPSDPILNFDILKNSIFSAMKRAYQQRLSFTDTNKELKNEIENLQKVIDNKVRETASLKATMGELKEDNLALNKELERILFELENKKNSELQMMLSYKDIEDNNNKYYDSLAKVINGELENILMNDELKSYAVIINTHNENINNSKFIFEDALDRMLTVNMALVDDIKRLIGKKKEEINNLHEELMNFENDIENAKNENSILLSQVNSLDLSINNFKIDDNISNHTQ